MAKAKNKKAKEKASQKFFLNQMFDKSFDEQDKIDELEGIMPLSDFEFKGRVPEAFPIWRCPNINLFTGGGILHIGKIVCAWGKEDCGKTLLAKMITLSALRQQIEVIYRDHEKKLSNTKLNYEQFNLTYEEVFGADPYTKERIKGIRRLVHVTQPTNGHQTFRSMRKRLRGLPHKKFFKGKWYLGFNTKIAKQKEKLEVILANEKKAKFKFLKLDKKVKFGGSKYKWYEILPDENGWVDDRPQALYIIDSIVTMLPEAFDEDDDKEAIREESGGQMNQAAIMFGGEHGWAYITGAAANKHVGIYCTNQLREKPGVTYGCLHGDTKIPFTDGRSFSIKEIVDNKIEGSVFSYNFVKNMFESKSIIDWFYNGKVEKVEDWVTIKTEAFGTRNGIICVTCTPNHTVFNEKGEKKKVKELVVGDKMLSKYKSILNGSLKQFLLGSFVGDSHLWKLDNNAALKLADSKNPKYLQWKLNKLASLGFRSVEKGYVSKPQYDFSLVKEKVQNRNPLPIIDSFDALSFAVLYMDDGTLKKRKAVTSCQASISFKRFKGNEEVIQGISDAFNERGYTNRYNLNEGSIWIYKEGFLKFCEDICVYIPESMWYKLPEEFQGKYQDFSLDYEEKTLETSVVILSKENVPSRLRMKDKYDIQIADNGNYLAGNSHGGVLVHNSPEYMPGGNATHQSQNARYRARKASIAMGMEKRTLFKGEMNKINLDNYLVEEPSVEFPGGSDHYKWSKLTTEKNHSYTPPTKHITFRIWLKDGEEKEASRGIDPAWEYYMAATNMGLIKRPARQDYITFLNKKLIWADKEKWTWLEFKALILLEGDDKKSARKYLRKMNLVPENPVKPKKLKGTKTKKEQEKHAKALKQYKKKLTVFKEKYAKVKKRCKGFNFKNYVDRLIDNGKAFPMYGATVSRKQISGGDDD